MHWSCAAFIQTICLVCGGYLMAQRESQGHKSRMSTMWMTDSRDLLYVKWGNGEGLWWLQQSATVHSYGECVLYVTIKKLI